MQLLLLHLLCFSLNKDLLASLIVIFCIQCGYGWYLIIAQLSDQVMDLTARMQEYERRQQPYANDIIIYVQSNGID